MGKANVVCQMSNLQSSTCLCLPSAGLKACGNCLALKTCFKKEDKFYSVYNGIAPQQTCEKEAENAVCC